LHLISSRVSLNHTISFYLSLSKTTTGSSAAPESDERRRLTWVCPIGCTPLISLVKIQEEAHETHHEIENLEAPEAQEPSVENKERPI
jgi:hypothetical protein